MLIMVVIAAKNPALLIDLAGGLLATELRLID